MGLFFVYILKSAVCLALFYLFYRLLLSRETFHRFNRVALLGILLLSCLIPLLEVTIKQEYEVHQTILTLEQLLLMIDTQAVAEVHQVEQPAVTGIQFALMVYLAGILFFICRNIYSLVRMGLLLREGRKEKMENGIRLVVHGKEIAPFSWMKYIVISQKDMNENGREILTHELAHIKKGHSFDLLLVDICIFFQWFNPGAWLLKQEIQNIHEYEADETVIKQGIDAKQYQLLLIKKAVGTRLYSMANSFNHSKLKKRITMMLKEKSSPWARLKYLYVLPLAAIAVTVFARPEISEKVEEISAVKVNDLTAIIETKLAEIVPADTVKSAKKLERVYDSPDVMPEYPGGTVEMIKYIQKNTKYPESAGNAGMQGRVLVQFVIGTDGKVSSPTIARSVDRYLDAEAIRVVSSMPHWIPGKDKGKTVAVKYTIPVVFKLNNDVLTDSLKGVIKSVDGKEYVQVPGGELFTTEGNFPLVMLDGKETTFKEGKIEADKIKNLNVYHREEAIKRYGEKGKNGVLVVTSYTDLELKNRAIALKLKDSASGETIEITSQDGLNEPVKMEVYVDGKLQVSQSL